MAVLVKNIVVGPVFIIPVGFIGLATISMGDKNSSDVATRTGVTYGGGFALTFSRKYQIGAIIGFDRLAGPEGEEWPFNGKPWVSVSIGYQFLDF